MGEDMKMRRGRREKMKGEEGEEGGEEEEGKGEVGGYFNSLCNLFLFACLVVMVHHLNS